MAAKKLALARHSVPDNLAALCLEWCVAVRARIGELMDEVAAVNAYLLNHEDSPLAGILHASAVNELEDYLTDAYHQVGSVQACVVLPLDESPAVPDLLAAVRRKPR